METRTNRYKDLDDMSQSRSERNKDLYKNIYEDTEYTNIEGITNIGRTNRIDIRTIRSMLNEEKEELPKRTAPIIRNEIEEEKEETRNYDIKEILDKAKSTYTRDDKERSLDSVNKLLARIDAQKEDEDKELEKDAKEIEQLMTTLTNTLALQKMSDEELSERLLFDSIPNDDIDVKKQEKEAFKDGNNTNTDTDFTMETTTLDTSFYTTKNSISKDDIQDEISDDDEEEGTNIVGIIILVVLILIAVGVIVFFALNS